MVLDLVWSRLNACTVDLPSIPGISWTAWPFTFHLPYQFLIHDSTLSHPRTAQRILLHDLFSATDWKDMKRKHA
ncbi:unnamed protein product [Caretta caretta]